MATALLDSVIQPSSKFAIPSPNCFRIISLKTINVCKYNLSMKHYTNISSGVCCIISTSTCSATVSTNTTYIRNPGWFEIPSINILWYHQECDNIFDDHYHVSTNTTYIRNPGWFEIPSINILWYHQECDNIFDDHYHVSTNTTYIRNPGWFGILSISHHQKCDNI